MVASYIEQDDALLGVLTVHETVEYAARLRSVEVTRSTFEYHLIRIPSLPFNTPSSIIQSLVDTTIASLGLTDVAKNRIGTPIQRGISGGQKRRVTIAASVVSRPRILLCDEPTSGLDSTTSFQVISSSEPYHVRPFPIIFTKNLQVKRLAQTTNTIVIATIHQPNWETLSLFDDVLFLSAGQCMYYGPVRAYPQFPITLFRHFISSPQLA
jgi:ABC-type multidrug transport system ATPase subunit